MIPPCHRYSTTLTVPPTMACADVARQIAAETRTFLSPMPLQRSSSYAGQQGQRQESKTKMHKTLQLRLPLGWLWQHLPMTCNRQWPLQPFSSSHAMAVRLFTRTIQNATGEPEAPGQSCSIRLVDALRWRPSRVGLGPTGV